MSLDVLNLFRRRRTAVWATTYTFEPGLFDDYIFRSIGEPPLNANILVDGAQIGRTWSKWAEEPWRLRRINRDYLVRPVHLPRGAFHPKTYLLAGKNSGTLLVGSGNLTMNGLVRGREVFSEFDSLTPEGNAAIGDWCAWLQRIIGRLGDFQLTRRWHRFVNDHSWLPAVPDESPFLHNLDRPILDQYISSLPSPVDELYILAPFYDAACSALSELLRQAAPRRCVVYLPSDASIDGKRLVSVLERTEISIEVCGFDRSDSIHAKLVGCVAGDEGFLLSGSANLSRPALLTTADGGNCEAAILSRISPDTLRGAFVPEGWAPVPLTSERLLELEFRSRADKLDPWPVTLQSASLGNDGHVRVSYEGNGQGNVASIDIRGERLPLFQKRTPQSPAFTTEPTLVFLVDGGGQTLSNTVPLDDESRLDSWLQTRSVKQDVPEGLWAGDLDSELGMMLNQMSRNFIFEIDQVVGHANGTGSQNGSQNEDAESAFWDKFDADMVRFDPRVNTYARLLNHASQFGWSGDGEVLGLLEGMIARFPGERLGIVPFSSASDTPDAHMPPKPNVQLRVGNVLSRWSKALNDPRYSWIDIGAPAVNAGVLLRALATCRLKRFVSAERISAITLSLLQSFLGSPVRKGYLLSLEDGKRVDVLGKFDPESRQLFTAMVYLALDPTSNWSAEVFEWQPYIVAAIGNGLLSAGDYTVEVIEEISAQSANATHGLPPITASDVEDHMMVLATYLNDSHWEKLQEDELGFADVRIKNMQGDRAKTWPYIVTVSGATKLRVEPRIVSLVNRVLHYKKCEGVVVEAAEPMANLDRPQRLSVNTGKGGSAFAVDLDGFFESRGEVSRTVLRSLEEKNRGFAALFEIGSKEVAR